MPPSGEMQVRYVRRETGKKRLSQELPYRVVNAKGILLKYHFTTKALKSNYGISSIS